MQPARHNRIAHSLAAQALGVIYHAQVLNIKLPSKRQSVLWWLMGHLHHSSGRAVAR